MVLVPEKPKNIQDVFVFIIPDHELMQAVRVHQLLILARCFQCWRVWMGEDTTLHHIVVSLRKKDWQILHPCNQFIASHVIHVQQYE